MAMKPNIEKEKIMVTAKDVMSAKFHTLLPNIHITEAVKIFQECQ